MSVEIRSLEALRKSGMREEQKADPVALPSGGSAFEIFEKKYLAAFYERSNSGETRRAYKRVTREFFRYFNWRSPDQISSEQVAEWRDKLKASRKKPATIVFKLSVVRSLYEYLRDEKVVIANPAIARKVPPPALKEDLRGRCLSVEDVRKLLAGPDRSRTDGARDYALMLLMLKTSLRVGEACSIRASGISWSHGRWLLSFTVKGGRERKIPLPKEVKEAIDAYLKLDRNRRRNLHSDGSQAYIFQPVVNYRTLEFDKPLSTTQAWKIVRRWGDFTGVGKVSPHDLRRTAITRALDQGISHRQVRMMTGHKSLEMVMRYDHNRESLELNAVNFLDYSTPSAARADREGIREEKSNDRSPGTNKEGKAGTQSTARER
jgi:integrase/recombinase XerD